MLITAGINDLDFSDIIYRCSSNVPLNSTNCVFGAAGYQLATSAAFAARYDALANTIKTRLPRVREVYVNGYPNRVFKGGGCDFGPGGPGGLGGIDSITSAEGDAMATLGDFLNNQIYHATRRHRGDAQGRWNYVEDLSVPFEPHAYCASVPWFNQWLDSWTNQGNEKGTAHPNRAGHDAFAKLLLRSVVPNQQAMPYRQVTLVIDALRYSQRNSGDTGNIDITLREYTRDLTGRTRRFTVPSNGEWTRIKPLLGTFVVPVFPAPASPRHATEVQLILNHILPIHHTLADGYGAGRHELTHPTGNLAVRYHVQVEAPDVSGDDPVVGHAREQRGALVPAATDARAFGAQTDSSK